MQKMKNNDVRGSRVGEQFDDREFLPISAAETDERGFIDDCVFSPDALSLHVTAADTDVSGSESEWRAVGSPVSVSRRLAGAGSVSAVVATGRANRSSGATRNH